MQSRVKSSILNAGLVLSWLVFGDPVAASEPPAPLKGAIQSYNARQYGQAISQLKALNGPAADDPYTHYYLALSYQGLSRFADAEREYRWNYQHGQDKDLRYKSWQGLQGLQSVTRARAVGSASATATAGAAGVNGGAPQATATATKVKVPTWEELGLKSKHVGALDNPFSIEWTPGCPRHR